MGNDQSKKKKGERILEEKKQQIANLTHKKEKLDRIHSAVNHDINQINNASLIQHHNPQNFSHSHSFNQSYLNQQNANDLYENNNYKNNLNRNNSFNVNNNNQNDFININEVYNPSSDKNSQNINCRNEIIRNSVLIPNPNNFDNNNLINKNSINVNSINANNQIKNQSNNQQQLRENNCINNNLDIETKNEKLIKDLVIMEKLVEKYKIVYLDSYYFKRDKNYNSAIERNLQGQEYTEKLLAILKQKKEKEYGKYINICINLENQFETLMQEIQSEMLSQGNNPKLIINTILSQKSINDNNNNNNNNNNKWFSCNIHFI